MANGEWNELSFYLKKQASNVYLFTQFRKAWEGHTVRSRSKYYILADTCAMISYDRLLVERSRATLCGEIGEKISVVLLTKADYFAEQVK